MTIQRQRSHELRQQASDIRQIAQELKRIASTVEANAEDAIAIPAAYWIANNLYLVIVRLKQVDTARLAQILTDGHQHKYDTLYAEFEAYADKMDIIPDEDDPRWLEVYGLKMLYGELK